MQKACKRIFLCFCLSRPRKRILALDCSRQKPSLTTVHDKIVIKRWKPSPLFEHICICFKHKQAQTFEILFMIEIRRYNFWKVTPPRTCERTHKFTHPPWTFAQRFTLPLNLCPEGYPAPLRWIFPPPWGKDFGIPHFWWTIPDTVPWKTVSGGRPFKDPAKGCIPWRTVSGVVRLRIPPKAACLEGRCQGLFSSFQVCLQTTVRLVLITKKDWLRRCIHSLGF